MEKHNLKKNVFLWSTKQAEISKYRNQLQVQLYLISIICLVKENLPRLDPFIISHSRQFCLHRAARSERLHREMEAAGSRFSYELYCSSFYFSSQLLWCQESCSFYSALKRLFTRKAEAVLGLQLPLLPNVFLCMLLQIQ